MGYAAPFTYRVTIEGPEVAMAKGQMRSNREKKKPKQDKNKKKGAEAPSPFARKQHALAAGVNDFIRGCTVARVAGCCRRVPNTAIEMQSEAAASDDFATSVSAGCLHRHQRGPLPAAKRKCLRWLKTTRLTQTGH